MDIIDLRDEAEHLATLAQWHHAEWGYLNPGGSVESRANKMRSYLGAANIPSTFVAKVGGVLAGSAAIVEHDMDTHKELTPWLASVYVSPEFRQQGIGAKLVAHVMNFAAEGGVGELYLFTDKQSRFYQRLGWSVVSTEVYRDVEVTIMKVRLNEEWRCSHGKA